MATPYYPGWSLPPAYRPRLLLALATDLLCQLGELGRSEEAREG